MASARGHRWSRRTIEKWYTRRPGTGGIPRLIPFKRLWRKALARTACVHLRGRGSGLLRHLRLPF
jgi:hypothetical protein